MIEIDHPTLGILEFPDGTSDDIIISAIKQAEMEAPAARPEESAPDISRSSIGQDYSLPAIGRDLIGTMASGIAGQVAGGLHGLYDLARGRGSDAAAQSVEQTAESMAIAPQTAGAQAVLGALEPVGRAAEAVTGALGNAAVMLPSVIPGVETPESVAPYLYAAGSAAPEAVGAVLGFPRIRPRPGRSQAAIEAIDGDASVAKQVQSAGPNAPSQMTPNPGSRPQRSAPTQPPDAPDGTPQVWPESPSQASLRRAILAGDKEGAGYRIEPNGAIVSDPLANSAIKQGFEPRVVSAVKIASPEDIEAMLKMLNIGDMSLKNANFAARKRPSSVIGDSVMERWNLVFHENKRALADAGKSAREELKGKAVDIEDAAFGFIDDLDNLNVRITDNGSLDFKGSQIEGNSSIPVIKRVYERLKLKDDGYSLHQLKQYIDRQIDWNKSPDNALDRQAVAALKNLRGRINERLRGESDSYAKANDRAAETFRAMEPVMDVMGRRFDPDSPGISEMVGQEMRNVLSNNKSRYALTHAVDNLDAAARKYRPDYFHDDPINQIVFFNEMERMFGSFAPRSFKGEISSAIEDTVGVAMAADPTTSVISGAARSMAKRLGKKNPEDAIRSMRALLSRD